MGFPSKLLSSTMLKRSLSCIILALLIVNANGEEDKDTGPMYDETAKLKSPITVTSRHLVPWKEVPMGTLLFKDKPERIGHTGSHCNWKGNKTTAKMGDEAGSVFDNDQYCTLRPEYLLEVENIENEVNLLTEGHEDQVHYTRLLKFKKNVTNPDEDIIVISKDAGVEIKPATATGAGYVTILEPRFVAEEGPGTKLNGAMHHRFLQHPAGGDITEGYWANYEKYSKMMLSETFESETNGDDLYIKKPLTRMDQEVSVYKYVPPLFALGELHKENYGVSGEKLPCGPLCTGGKHILVENIGHRTFEANVFIRTDCEWMEVCFSVDEVKELIDGHNVTKYYCRGQGPHSSTENDGKTVHTAFLPLRQNRLQVVFKNGIVKMPFQKQPFIHDFDAIRSHKDAFRLSIMRNHDNVLVLTTESRERMVNIRGTSFSSSMLFSFSDSKCIHHENSFGGLFSGASKDQYQIVQKDEVRISPVNYLKDADVTKMTPRPILENLDDYKPPSEDKLLPAAPAKDANVTNVFANTGEHSALPLSQAVSGDAGWQTWMIFFGFLCGTFTGTVIAGGILFVLRRSIFDEWYRGMFKRYHCDPSSQTGQTGADFAAETTNGASQMSQMSTVQSAMSTVGNSTMGPASGMDTTGGGTTGGDMVTM